MTLTWEDKLAILQGLKEASLLMRKGDWYVQQSIEIGGDGMLSGRYGNGATPEAAVKDHWRKLVELLPADRYLVYTDAAGYRRQVRWTGFTWKDVPQMK